MYVCVCMRKNETPCQVSAEYAIAHCGVRNVFTLCLPPGADVAGVQGTGEEGAPVVSSTNHQTVTVQEKVVQ